MTRPGAILAVALLLLGSASPARADAAADALKAMQTANDFLEKSQYDSAIAGFNEARKLSPTSSGPYLGLGLAYSAMGRCDEAIVALEEYLRRRVKDPKPAAKAALDSCKTRKSAPSKLRVESVPFGAEVRLDAEGGPALGITPFEMPSVPPGFHKIYLSKGGYQPHISEIRTEPGGSSTVSASLVVVPAPSTEPAVPRPDGTVPKPDATGPKTESPKSDAAGNAKKDSLMPVEIPPDKQAYGPREAPTTGHLSINSATKPSSVFINGDRVAANGIVELDLPPGLYAVTVEREGYVGAAASVTLLAGERKAFTTELKLMKRHGMAALGGVMTVLALGGAGAAVAGHLLADHSVAGTDTFDTYHQLELYGYVGAGSAAGLATLFFVLDYVLNRGRVDEGAPPPMVPVRQ